MEAAALRLLAARAFSYQSLKSVLASGLDRAVHKEEPARPPVPLHENIRGRDYYQ